MREAQDDLIRGLWKRKAEFKAGSKTPVLKAIYGGEEVVEGGHE